MYPNQPYPSNQNSPYPPADNASKAPYPGFNVFPTPNQGTQGDMNTSSTPYPSASPYPPSSMQYPPTQGYPPNQGYPPSNMPSAQGFNQPPNQYNTSSNFTASQPNNQGYNSNQYQSFQNNPSLHPYMNPGSSRTDHNQFGYSDRPPPSNDPYKAPTQNYPQPGQYHQNENKPKSSEYAPSIRDMPGFDGRRDAEALRKAMKGFGTDEQAIINVLAKRTNGQRQKIKMEYKMLYGKDLVSDLKSELSGRFEDVIVALMTPTYEYDASLLRGAIRGLGTDEDLLIEILSSRSPSDIRQIKDVYRQLFKKDLEKDIIQDTSGHFQRLLVSLSTGMRDEGNNVDPGLAKRDAEALLRAGVKMWGTDESVFNSILASRNFNQLRATFEEYQRMAGHPIDAAIRSEMSGDLANGMLAVAKCAQYRPAYFAERLYLSMKGMGTRDDMLIRIVVTRCEVDMVNIKAEFQRMYGKSLESFISGDCSGDYKKVLIALVQGNC